MLQSIEAWNKKVKYNKDNCNFYCMAETSFHTNGLSAVRKPFYLNPNLNHLFCRRDANAAMLSNYEVSLHETFLDSIGLSEMYVVQFVPGCTNALYSTRSISCWQTWKKKERRLLKISTAPDSRISTPSCMRCLFWCNFKPLQSKDDSLKSFRKGFSLMPFDIWCIFLNRPWSTSRRRRVFIRNPRLWRSSSLPCCLTNSLS